MNESSDAVAPVAALVRSAEGESCEPPADKAELPDATMLSMPSLPAEELEDDISRRQANLGGLWVACERCRTWQLLHDVADDEIPFDYWYCEYNPDPDAEMCTPTVQCPLRGSRMGARKVVSPPDYSNAAIEEMLGIFPKLKQEGREQEIELASGWIAVYKKRKRGDGGDIYVSREGEATLRSAMDVKRRLGLLAARNEA